MNIGIVILAAGASTRMGGQPKQLIQWEGRTLIRWAVETALSTPLRPVAVVLGANKAQIAGELESLPVTIIDNPFWEQGLSSSIKTGLAAVYLTQKNIDAVLFMLTDQPHVNRGLLLQLVHVYTETGKPIVASRYADQLGVPALFGREYLEKLLGLEGDQGARMIIQNHLDDCAEVPFEPGAIDLDTASDVETFLG